MNYSKKHIKSETGGRMLIWTHRNYTVFYIPSTGQMAVKKFLEVGTGRRKIKELRRSKWNTVKWYQ